MGCDFVSLACAGAFFDHEVSRRFAGAVIGRCSLPCRSAGVQSVEQLAEIKVV